MLFPRCFSLLYNAVWKTSLRCSPPFCCPSPSWCPAEDHTSPPGEMPGCPCCHSALTLEPPLQRGLWLIPSFVLQQSALRYCFKHFSHLTHLFVCLFLIQLLMLEYRFCDSRNILSSLRVYILNRADIIPRGQNYLTFEESIISLFLCI